MKFHFIGIGGVGMSALARMAIQKGFEVSGSDLKMNKALEELQKLGATIFLEHSREHVEGKDFIIFSTAINNDNPEFFHAPKEKLLHRSELLAKFLESKKAIVIAGAHGKTTTTSLMAHTLKKADLAPSFAVGGFSPSLDLINGIIGEGEFFVVEGDESDGSFLNIEPYAAIITNVDFDHLDFWKEEKKLLSAYKQFISKTQNPGLVFYPKSDKHLSMWGLNGVDYGEEKDSKINCFDLELYGNGQKFSIGYKGKIYKDIYLNLLGKHNVYNALGVFGLAFELGVDVETIKNAFKTFEGVKRRLEFKKVYKSSLIYDDYAHHPEEIKAIVKTIALVFDKKKKIAIFQPHRNSRFSDFFPQFIESQTWEGIDKIIITDIYAALERVDSKFSVIDFIREMKPFNVEYVPRNKIAAHVKKIASKDSVFVTLGAGDITNLSNELEDE
jgi:UDP-N-acetylmuramate--alanine ligase